jgi:hypothetical protein
LGKIGRPKGSRNKVHREHLAVGTYKVRREVLEKFHRLYPKRTSLLLREFVEALVHAREGEA